MSLKVSDLCAVDFRSKLLTPEIKNWCEQTGIPYAESCARQVWWGSKTDFDNMPDSGTFSIPRMEGVEAYSFLVKLVLGLDSKIVGETVIKGQFRQGFEKFSEDWPDKAKIYDSIAQAIQADSRLVKGLALDCMTTTRKEIVARDLSGFQVGEEVLLISSLNKQGNLSDITDRLARILGSRDKRKNSRCPKILVLSPDSETTHKIEQGLIQLKKDHRQFAIPEIGDIADVPEFIEKFPRTFIDLPMGEYPEIDEYIIAAWTGRVHENHQMVHVRGCPQNRGMSDNIWENAGLENYHSPEAIRDEAQRRVGVNNDLRNKAIELITHCSDLRVNGIQPSKKQLRPAIESMALRAA